MPFYGAQKLYRQLPEKIFNIAHKIDSERELIDLIHGLDVPALEIHFTPCIKIGWRLRPDY